MKRKFVTWLTVPVVALPLLCSGCGKYSVAQLKVIGKTGAQFGQDVVEEVPKLYKDGQALWNALLGKSEEAEETK